MLKEWRNVDRVRLDLIYRRLNIKVKRFLLQNFRTLFWSTDEQTRCVLPHAATFCGLQARRQFKKHDGPFHRWHVFCSRAFQRPRLNTCNYISSVADTRHSVFFASVTIPTSLHWLNWAFPGSQIVRGKCTRNVRGVEKSKKESLPRLYYSEQINEY